MFNKYQSIEQATMLYTLPLSLLFACFAGVQETGLSTSLEEEWVQRLLLWGTREMAITQRESFTIVILWITKCFPNSTGKYLLYDARAKKLNALITLLLKVLYYQYSTLIFHPLHIYRILSLMFTCSGGYGDLFTRRRYDSRATPHPADRLSHSGDPCPDGHHLLHILSRSVKCVAWCHQCYMLFGVSCLSLFM